MDEILVFISAIFFGAFFFILVLMCCLRFFAYLRDEDRKHLCFKRKHSALRRRRIQLSLLPETVVLHRTENLGYTAAPDENIDQHTICQPYVYEDGRSTGMRMIANLPIAIAFTSHSGIPADSLFGVLQSFPLSPRLGFGHHFIDPTQNYDELPPPDYIEAQIQSQAEKLMQECMEIDEPPPPSYDECMNTASSPLPDNKDCQVQFNN